MHFSPTKTTFAALALLGSVQAHTRFTTLFVDGHNQGDGVCIRMDMNGETTNSPIAGLQSPEMACGRNGETGVARVCPAKGGSVLTFEFREWVDGSRPGALDPQHEGPCAVYLKKVDSAIASNNAAGNGWFKIWDESFDEAAGKWCTNKMIDNNGHLSVTLPADIEGGYYLVRPELLALHAAQDNPPDPQFYVGCAQVYLDSTGTAKPATVTIPQNYVDISMPGLTFNIYSKPLALPYPMYGPPAYKGGGAAAAPSASPSAAPTPSSTGTATSPSVSAPVKAASGSAANATASYDSVADDTTDGASDNATRDASDGSTDDSADAATSDATGDAADDSSDDSSDGECATDEGEDTTDDNTDGSADGSADDSSDALNNSSNSTHSYGRGSSDTTKSPAAPTSSVAAKPSASSGGTRYMVRATPPSGNDIEGQKPAGCIMVNANWCGFEVKAYTNENGCWSASADCWSQSKVCFDQAPPTGAKNCDLWNDKCNHLDDTCNAKQFTGPPDAGKDLTPTPPDLAASAYRKLMALVKKHESHMMRHAYRARVG